MRSILLMTLSLLPFFVFSQNDSRLTVEIEGYQNPFTGGFEAPQFQAINLNDDGQADLLVFDRKGSKILTFLYDASLEFPYKHAPEYEAAFPDIGCWVIVRDYDQDGIDDLFTCGVTDPVTGIEVWKGSKENGNLSFSPYQHPNGFYNIIYYERNGDHKQLYVGNNGIPGIADIDDDGDIDVLAFQPSGGYLYYFQNMSQERGFASDSLIFERMDECWGNFYEGGLVPDIVLSDDMGKCALPDGFFGAKPRHEGITVSIFDKNKDGIKDLLIGEVSSSNLIYIGNGGTKDKAFATYKEVDFPINDVPADMQIFLGSFILDADHDGVEDILVAPNSQFGTNTEQVSFYQGVDTNFQLVQEDWLVGTSLDFGTDAYPSFLDYNADGLMDFVVGSFGLIGLETGTETRLYLFENVGSADEPSFFLKDDNYLNFLLYSEFDKSYTPSFGDIDGDGDVDMILGTLSGDLLFSENTGGPGNPVQFSSPVFDYKGLDTENNTVKAEIADVNQDGLGDIIVGGRNSYSLSESIGSLKTFINTGSASSPEFENGSTIIGLGAVNVKDAGTSKVSAAPKFYSDGEIPLLFVGNETGRVAVYEVEEDGIYELVTENLLGRYVGRRVTIDVADIDNDGFLEMIVGNERGGVELFNTVIQVSGEISSTKEHFIKNDLVFYPNPTTDYIYFDVAVEAVKVYNLLGQRVFENNSLAEKIDLQFLENGVYYLVADGRSGKFVKSGR